jgi:hypothetical protein
MKIQTGRQKLDDFIGQADRDKDPYLLVHFSRTDDKYMGYNSHMDIGDALIIIHELCNQFDIEKRALV